MRRSRPLLLWMSLPHTSFLQQRVLRGSRRRSEFSLLGEAIEPDVIYRWLRGAQPDIKNSAKMMAGITWLFLGAEDEDSQRILYSGTHGQTEYDGVWARGKPRLLRATQQLQALFATVLFLFSGEADVVISGGAPTDVGILASSSS